MLKVEARRACGAREDGAFHRRKIEAFAVANDDGDAAAPSDYVSARDGDAPDALVLVFLLEPELALADGRLADGVEQEPKPTGVPRLAKARTQPVTSRDRLHPVKRAAAAVVDGELSRQSVSTPAIELRVPREASRRLPNPVEELPKLRLIERRCVPSDGHGQSSARKLACGELLPRLTRGLAVHDAVSLGDAEVHVECLNGDHPLAAHPRAPMHGGRSLERDLALAPAGDQVLVGHVVDPDEPIGSQNLRSFVEAENAAVAHHRRLASLQALKDRVALVRRRRSVEVFSGNAGCAELFSNVLRMRDGDGERDSAHVLRVSHPVLDDVADEHLPINGVVQGAHLVVTAARADAGEIWQRLSRNREHARLDQEPLVD